MLRRSCRGCRTSVACADGAPGGIRERLVPQIPSDCGLIVPLSTVQLAPVESTFGAQHIRGYPCDRHLVRDCDRSKAFVQNPAVPSFTFYKRECGNGENRMGRSESPRVESRHMA